MENPTKILILALGLGVFSCKVRNETPGNPSNIVPDQPSTDFQKPVLPKVSQTNKRPIGKGLYRDSLGTLYLKTENRKVQTPTNERSDWPDSIFHSRVSLRETGTDRSLSEVLDAESFSRIDDNGVYFEDTAYIYVYATWPLPDQFFALKKTGYRFLDTKKEYLLVGGILYWNGKIVDSISAEKAKVIRFKNTSKEGYYEFITDGKFLIYGYYPLSEKRLAYFDDLSDGDKDKIRRHYFRMKSKSRLETAQ